MKIYRLANILSCAVLAVLMHTAVGYEGYRATEQTMSKNRNSLMALDGLLNKRSSAASEKTRLTLDKSIIDSLKQIVKNLDAKASGPIIISNVQIMKNLLTNEVGVTAFRLLKPNMKTAFYNILNELDSSYNSQIAKNLKALLEETYGQSILKPQVEAAD